MTTKSTKGRVFQEGFAKALKRLPDSKGELPMVREHLRNVSHLASSRSAFAALISDGTVATWGDVRFGGNSDDVSEQLKEAAVTGARAIYDSSIYHRKW